MKALAATGEPGVVAVIDLDRVHLQSAGVAGDLLHEVLSAVGGLLRGRAPWFRLETDVIVLVVPAVADESAGVALATEVLGVIAGVVAEAELAHEAIAVCGLAWQRPAATAQLAAALDACWRARHVGPALVVGSVPHRNTPAPPAPPPQVAPVRRPPEPVAPLLTPHVPPADAEPPDAEPPDAEPPDAISDDAVSDRRAEIDRFLLEISGQALGIDPTVFVVGLGDVMRDLAQVAGADYAFVDTVIEGGRAVQNLAGWSADAHPGFVRREARPLQGDRDWHQMMAALEPVVVNDQFASHGGAHPGNHPAGGVSRSFITIPFVVGGLLAGALGVGCIDRARAWTSDEITALRLTTGLVAAVLDRVRSGDDGATG